MLRAADLEFDSIIPARRKTTNGTLSGVMDTKNCQEAWIMLHKGLVGASTTAYKLTYRESDTVSATFSDMATTISLSTAAAAGLSTAALQHLAVFQCSNGSRKRFIGVKLSTTAGTSRAVGVFGFKVKLKDSPVSSTQGFTSVTYV